MNIFRRWGAWVKSYYVQIVWITMLSLNTMFWYFLIGAFL